MAPACRGLVGFSPPSVNDGDLRCCYRRNARPQRHQRTEGMVAETFEGHNATLAQVQAAGSLQGRSLGCHDRNRDHRRVGVGSRRCAVPQSICDGTAPNCRRRTASFPLGCVARSPPLPWLQGRAASAELSRAFLAIAEIHATAPRAVPAPGSRLRNLYSSETQQTP
jgi:hypothetical protein